VNIREVVLERLQVAASARLSAEFAFPAHVDAVVDPLCNALVLTVVQAVAGEQIERICVSYPDGWWQAVRERWFPKRWLARHPVRMKSFELVANGLYPKLSLPNQYGSRIVLYTQETPWGDR
jgi:hypothetical protein